MSAHNQPVFSANLLVQPFSAWVLWNPGTTSDVARGSLSCGNLSFPFDGTCVVPELMPRDNDPDICQHKTNKNRYDLSQKP